ncbi:MAG: SHOCT domain-containing protein [Oscillospiraceae bacterium]|nr:SHOCT domain-containing protein [Oscillospiraceae bacterium]
MRRRYRITHRPSKAGGIMGTVFGCIFILIGLFVAIPMAGLFGILWTAIAVGITAFNAYAAFGKNKNGTYNEYMGNQIDIEQDNGSGFYSAGEYMNTAPITDAEARLQQLERLRESGLITEDEYSEKREEIIRGL